MSAVFLPMANNTSGMAGVESAAIILFSFFHHLNLPQPQFYAIIPTRLWSNGGLDAAKGNADGNNHALYNIESE